MQGKSVKTSPESVVIISLIRLISSYIMKVTRIIVRVSHAALSRRRGCSDIFRASANCSLRERFVCDVEPSSSG
jgi:hypothetical protein